MNSDNFKKVLEKKKSEGKMMSPAHKKAKSSVLEDLMGELGGMNLDKIKGMKKISIAADSKEGLKEGMKKAAELVDKHPDSSYEGQDDVSDDAGNEPDEESMEHEMSESPEEESMEDHSPEELEAKIQELQKQLNMMKMK